MRDSWLPSRDGHAPIFDDAHRCASDVHNSHKPHQIVKNQLFLTKILWYWTLIFHSWGWIKPSGMNNNDILGTQNWKQSQADPFLAQKIAIFGKYLYVDNVDEIFIRIRIFTHMRIIRMNHIFRIRIPNPNSNICLSFFCLNLPCWLFRHLLYLTFSPPNYKN